MTSPTAKHAARNVLQLITSAGAQLQRGIDEDQLTDSLWTEALADLRAACEGAAREIERRRRAG